MKPPKRGAKVEGGRAIDRLRPQDRRQVLAQVQLFIEYAKAVKARKEWLRNTAQDTAQL